ncbi:MAG: replication-associated recombination protein A [Chitinophagales bacterium]|nr:replication-associated recombination protein A [Chitinophagales bacterium]MDW8419276.1 replication-associated recombination protein A [Chitinophagales bacterium]
MQPPLPERLRPKAYHEFAGQQHLLGEGKILRRLIESGNIPSMIFWGPPGVGKTSLARFIAAQTRIPFYPLSAIDSGVKELRKVIDEASLKGRCILFIDEIHRFNKTQQDALLGAVERGTVILIGATTENPSFEVVPALLSRCQVYVLKPLERGDLEQLLARALSEDTWLRENQIAVTEAEAILRYSGGDARKLLNVLEIAASAALAQGVKQISNELVEAAIQQKMALYDKSGEMHYDIISAFIKSIRGSDPNAALYYLARMIEGGEDPQFIARRLVILASEDIGNANPNALLLATSCFQAVSMIGYPECRIILSQVVIYLAASPKSNSAYTAIDAAQQLVKKTGDLPVPLSIRNAPTALMKNLQYGKDYLYAHDYEGNFVAMEFMPDAIRNTKLYEPGDNAREKELRAYLKKCWREKYGY